MFVRSGLYKPIWIHSASSIVVHPMLEVASSKLYHLMVVNAVFTGRDPRGIAISIRAGISSVRS